MAKKKADPAVATVSPIPMQQIVITTEPIQISEQVLQTLDQTQVEPMEIQEPEEIQQPVQPLEIAMDFNQDSQIVDQTQVEPLIIQEQILPDRTTTPETADQQLPESQELPKAPEPKKELTFEQKVVLRALKRNAVRAAKKFGDALTSLINPVEIDDNPDRA